MLSNRRTLTIEWGHCDPAGIVFYPRYFEYFDASTALLLTKTGLGKARLREKHNILGFPMVDTHARFKLPSRYGDEVTIETVVTRVGNSSFDIHHTLLTADDRTGIQCTETRVWVREEQGRLVPTRLPPDIATLLSSDNS